MTSFSCPVCGGKLNIRIGSELAVCENCGNSAGVDPADAARFCAVYREAEGAMRRGSAAGYREAIRTLREIAFIREAEELTAECERRLAALKSDQILRQETEKTSEKRNAALGVLLLAVTLLVCVGAIAGAAYLVFRLLRGGPAPGELATVAGVAVLAVLLILFSKNRH